MGWLFAVALGLHRQNQRLVVMALLPIALGHALAIFATIALAMILGTLINSSFLAIACGIVLITWAFAHRIYGHRHRLRIGLTTSMLGLAAWSFIMALVHGAGLMILPALMPLQTSHAHSHSASIGSIPTASAALAVHTLAMLLATGSIALIVYHWVGLAILRRAWINFDALWTGALLLGGLWLIFPNIHYP